MVTLEPAAARQGTDQATTASAPTSQLDQGGPDASSHHTLVALDAGVDRARPSRCSRDRTGSSRGGRRRVSTSAGPRSASTRATSWSSSAARSREQALDFIGEAARRVPGAPVVVLSRRSPNGFMRHGSRPERRTSCRRRRDRAPSPASCASRVEKAVARRQGGAAAGAAALGVLICVLGPKGGIGKTLTTANLAVALADAGHSVVARRPRPPVRRPRARARPRPGADVYDLAMSGRLARRREGRGAT